LTRPVQKSSHKNEKTGTELLRTSFRRYLWQRSQQPLHDFSQDCFPPQPQEPWRRICHTAKIAQPITSASKT
jgi:hypothetical protein